MRPGAPERVGAAPWMGRVVWAVVVLVTAVVLMFGWGTPVATTTVVLWAIAGGATGLESVSTGSSLGGLKLRNGGM